MGYSLITCIIEKGKASDIVDQALKNGASGATYFDAKGRGVREKIGIRGMFIKEEKEIIMIVVSPEQKQEIFDTVVRMGGLTETGKGFAFVQPVELAVGFVMM
ncbi:MAG: P-II family nitrogen regulator [Elusimicrobiota bacterium]